MMWVFVPLSNGNYITELSYNSRRLIARFHSPKEGKFWLSREVSAGNSK